jgi:hypothetical protein
MATLDCLRTWVFYISDEITQPCRFRQPGLNRQSPVPGFTFLVLLYVLLPDLKEQMQASDQTK